MDPNEPLVVIEGLEEIIERDLGRHKVLLDRSHGELQAYRRAKSHEIQRKRYYHSLIGGGKYDDNALREGIKQINQNINHLAQKVKLSKDAIEHHQHIVDTLTAQLEDQNNRLDALRRSNGAD